MTSSEIQKLLQKLSFMHDKFQNVNYKLTSLDVEAVKQVTAQLYAECLAFRTDAPRKVVQLDTPPTVSTPTPVSPPVTPPQNSEVSQLNNEIEEVFETPTPPKPAPRPVAKPSPPVTRPPEKESKPLDLNELMGINEQIMFANELYNGNKPALVNTMRKLVEMPSKEEAIKHFDQVLEPFFIQEQKDEEVVKEFRDLLDRVFQK